MKKAILLLLAIAVSPAAQSGEELTGDVGLACEAILCLSSGERPGECSPSLSRYFSIKKKKFSKTLKARINFLNLCPVVAGDAKMKSLVDAIAHGAGRCDAAALNSSLMRWNMDTSKRHISNKLPSYCNSYSGHEYTDLSDEAARYVGDPKKGGFWTPASKYEAALERYKKQLYKYNKGGMFGWNN